MSSEVAIASNPLAKTASGERPLACHRCLTRSPGRGTPSSIGGTSESGWTSRMSHTSTGVSSPGARFTESGAIRRTSTIARRVVSSRLIAISSCRSCALGRARRSTLALATIVTSRALVSLVDAKTFAGVYWFCVQRTSRWWNHCLLLAVTSFGDGVPC